MKIIFSKTVLKDFKKICDEIDKFVGKLKNDFDAYRLYLKRPYIKIKVKLCNKWLRIVARYDEKSDNLLIVLVYNKSDKQYWYNLTWDKVKNLIILKLRKIEKEIIAGDYFVF